MTTAAHLAVLSDAELIAAVRGGDTEAYGALFERHVTSARRLAGQLARDGEADDLVSEAFVKLLAVLQAGGGPDVAFRAYLLTAVRRLHVDRVRGLSRVQPTDDLTPFDPGVPFRDIALEGFENGAAARAFASLPERWQLVLWHLEVEGSKPAEIAALLGMSANSVSALAYRAREGLRQAYLGAHIADPDDALCSWTRTNLGPYVRDGVSKRDRLKVETHLEECRACSAIYMELSDINSNLGALIAPLVLGGFAAAYAAAGAVTSGVGASASGTVSQLVGRARDFVSTNLQAVVIAGVAASAIVAGSAIALTLSPEPAPSGGRTPVSQAPPAATSPDADPVPEGVDDPESVVQVTIDPDSYEPTTTVTTGPAPTPTPTEPTPTDPGTPKPTPSEPTPTEPTPTEPTPTEPTPTEPTPTEPTPTEPTPTEPTPTEPTPTEPTPTEPTPTEPEPTTTDLAPDLAVSGEGARKTLTSTVKELHAGWRATQTITVTNASSVELTDPRCSQFVDTITCDVTGENPSVTFVATFPSGGLVSVRVSSPQEPWWQLLNNFRVFQIFS